MLITMSQKVAGLLQDHLQREGRGDSDHGRGRVPADFLRTALRPVAVLLRRCL